MKILCFGDSNTYGYDPRGYLGGRYDCHNRWPELLADKTGHTVINAGANGRSIPYTAASLPPDSLSADRILVMLGTNDLLQGSAPEEAGIRMEHFLRQLPREPQVVLIAPPPMQRGSWVPKDDLVAASLALGQQYRALAHALAIPFVDTRQWKIPLAFDGVHFTEEGHHTFGQQIAAFLNSNPQEMVP